MFSRISTVGFYALTAFSILAVATPGGKPTYTTTPPVTTKPPVTTTVTVTAPPTTTTITSSQCTTGPVQCCDSTATADSAAGAAILGLLGIVVQDVNVLLGITCVPISVIGAGGSSCSATTVCCEDNSHGGLVSIGCVPVIL